MENTSIRTKKASFDLWRSGNFGNKLRSWTVEEYRKSDFPGRVAIRTTATLHGSRPCIYNLQPGQVEVELAKLAKEGSSIDQLMVNEMAPDDKILIQGEYYNGALALNDQPCWNLFFYSPAKKPMREALKDCNIVATNLRSFLLLKNCMSPSSWEDWKVLCDRYSDHVLEVSIYDCFLGDIPGRNTLVWEIRQY